MAILFSWIKLTILVGLQLHRSETIKTNNTTKEEIKWKIKA